MPLPTMMAVGVASPMAHGQAITRTAIANRKAVRKSLERTEYQTAKVAAASSITIGTNQAETVSAWIMERCQRDALTSDGIGAAIYSQADAGNIEQWEATLLVRSLLSAGVDGFLTRAQMINAAERTLDLQYFIFRQDETGQLLTDALLRAADPALSIARIKEG